MFPIFPAPAQLSTWMSTVSRIVTSCKITYSAQNNNDFEHSNFNYLQITYKFNTSKHLKLDLITALVSRKKQIDLYLMDVDKIFITAELSRWTCSVVKFITILPSYPI